MFELIFFFALGFFVSRLTKPKIRADTLLYWNKDCLGWRPVASQDEINPSIRYMAAVEVEPTSFVSDAE